MITYVGIVGPSPRPRPEPVQSDRFDRLQRFVGSLEGASAPEFPALHAACHAFMNGVGRVVFSSVAEPASEQSWVEALQRLFRSDPLPVVVAPGGPSAALAEAFRKLPHTALSCLWVDGDTQPPGAPRVRTNDQLVPTQSPGRSVEELLCGTALVAPLHLGTVCQLRGLHGRPRPDGLLGLDARGKLTLTRPLSPPGTGLAPPEPSVHSSVEFRLNAALGRMAAPIVLTESEGPLLYARLRREADVILRELQRTGAITRYSVDCSASTSEGADGPVIEVRFAEPRRVEQVVLRVGRLSSDEGAG